MHCILVTNLIMAFEKYTYYSLISMGAKGTCANGTCASGITTWTTQFWNYRNVG